MKHLVYGILREGETEPGSLPQGLEGDTVSLLAEGGLVAAFSLVPSRYAAPDVPCLMTYAKVIEALGRRGTILPFRYGCLLENKDQVSELLRRRRQVFHTALAEVDGCVEMGLRVLLEETAFGDTATRRHGDAATKDWETFAASSARRVAASPGAPGTAYLADRKASYAERDHHRQEADGVIDNLRAAMAGLFVKCQAEQVMAEQGRLQAIHFLVRRTNVERFRDAFHRLQEARSDKILLTGPWPPYNFVAANSLGLLP